MTNGQRYVYNSTLLDFYSSQAACVRQGGNLVVYEVGPACWSWLACL
jgi:hypothetical protein